MLNRYLCILVSGLSLVGCAASPQSIATLNQLSYDCSRGYREACAYLPAQQAQVRAEEAQNTQNLAIGLGALAVVGTVVGVAASSDEGYYHHGRGYYGRHGY